MRWSSKEAGMEEPHKRHRFLGGATDRSGQGFPLSLRFCLRHQSMLFPYPASPQRQSTRRHSSKFSSRCDPLPEISSCYLPGHEPIPSAFDRVPFNC